VCRAIQVFLTIRFRDETGLLSVEMVHVAADLPLRHVAWNEAVPALIPQFSLPTNSACGGAHRELSTIEPGVS
jgi:hypothetical protein